MLTNTEAKTKPEVDSKVDSKSDSKVDSKSDSKVDSKSEYESDSEANSTTLKYLCWNCNNIYSSKEYQLLLQYCSDSCNYEHSNTTCHRCDNKIASDPDSRKYQCCEEHADDV